MFLNFKHLSFLRSEVLSITYASLVQYIPLPSDYASSNFKSLPIVKTVKFHHLHLCATPCYLLFLKISPPSSFKVVKYIGGPRLPISPLTNWLSRTILLFADICLQLTTVFKHRHRSVRSWLPLAGHA